MAKLQFYQIAPGHTAGEEESLFPGLRASGDPQAVAALGAVRRLEADHRVGEEYHAAVDDLGRRWLSAGTLTETDAAALVRHIEALQHLYGGHIDVEDRELFPTAARLLSESDLEAMGREMADRRGVPFDPPEEFEQLLQISVAEIRMLGSARLRRGVLGRISHLQAGPFCARHPIS